jgi:hypothetical protein
VLVALTPGQAGDNPQLLPLLDQVAVGRAGPGRPRKRPERVLADKAHSHPSTRAALRRRAIGFTSPETTDQTARRAAKGSRGGRPPAFGLEARMRSRTPPVREVAHANEPGVAIYVSRIGRSLAVCLLSRRT